MQQEIFQEILRSHRFRIEFRISQISSMKICDSLKE